MYLFGDLGVAGGGRVKERETVLIRRAEWPKIKTQDVYHEMKINAIEVNLGEASVKSVEGELGEQEIWRQ